MCESAMTYSGGFDLFCMIAQGDYQFWLLRENHWKGPQGPKDDAWYSDHFSEILCRTLKLNRILAWTSSKSLLHKPDPFRYYSRVCIGIGFWMSWLVGKLVHDDADDKEYTDMINFANLYESVSELKKASKKGHRKAGPLGIPQGYGCKGSTRGKRGAQVLLCPFWKPHGEKNCKAPYQCLNCWSLVLHASAHGNLRETKVTSGTHASIRFKVLGIAGS